MIIAVARLYLRKCKNLEYVNGADTSDVLLKRHRKLLRNNLFSF